MGEAPHLGFGLYERKANGNGKLHISVQIEVNKIDSRFRHGDVTIAMRHSALENGWITCSFNRFRISSSIWIIE